MSNDSMKISFSLGSGNNLGKPENVTETWGDYKKRFKHPLVTQEKFHEFKKASDAERLRLKGANGWQMRAPVEKGQNRKRNSVLPGYLITLDWDHLPPEFSQGLITGDRLPGVEQMGHSSRSHTPEKPRLRTSILCNRKVAREEYEAVSRILAQQIDPGLKHVDKVSFRPAQMMFMPTVSRDMKQHYVYFEHPGEPLDVDGLVEKWEMLNGPSCDPSNLPRTRDEAVPRDASEKAEDPLLKKGPVGHFCRAYTITDLVVGKGGELPLLDGIYEIDDWAQGAASRMTYIPGHGQNGAVVYEDKFVFSHHGSDPAGDMLCNAWDLVRMHLFDGKDDDQEKPMAQRDSWKKMVAYAKDLGPYRRQVGLDRYDMSAMLDDADDMDWVEGEAAIDLLGFDHVTVEERQKVAEADDEEIDELLGVPVRSVIDHGPDRYQRLRAVKPPKDWIAGELELDTNGNIKATITNIAIIIGNDSRLWRKIAFNEFSNQVVLLSDIATRNSRIPSLKCQDKERGTNWSDINDIVIRAIIEGPAGPGLPGYGTQVSDRNLVGAVKLAARRNSFHPIREMLDNHRKNGWDGNDRISTFFSRHLGAEQNDYTAMVMRMMMIASVARIEKPGCKFDYACILQGGQGIGKSTTIKLLYGEDYFGELDCDLADRKAVAEQISGKWGTEIPELSAFTKSDHNHSKAFLRRQHDDVRMSYDRTVSVLPRQCVVWGTTNDDQVLRDATGNRSYWMISCGEQMIDFAAILRERDQLWAQAVFEHDQMREQYPHGDLPLTLTGEALEIAMGVQEEARQKEMWEEWVDDIVEWAEKPIVKRHLLISMGAEVNDIGSDGDHDMVVRVGFTQQQAAVGALGLREGAFTNPTQQVAWNKAKAELLKRGFTTSNCRSAGIKSRWILLPNTDPDHIWKGYRPVDDLKHTGDSQSALNGFTHDFEDLI